jgi:hypothetical protein
MVFNGQYEQYGDACGGCTYSERYTRLGIIEQQPLVRRAGDRQCRAAENVICRN